MVDGPASPGSAVAAVQFTAATTRSSFLPYPSGSRHLNSVMTSVDLQQAISIPIPPSPPADYSTPHELYRAGPDSETIPRDSAEEIHVLPADDAPSHEEVNGVVNGSNGDAAVEVKEEAQGEPVHVSVSSEDTTTQNNGGAPQVLEVEHSEQAALPSVPPTPPSKASNLPEDVSPSVRTAPVRSDSLASSVTNGRPPPSVDVKRANGHISAQNSPSRPDSAASHRRSLTISKGRTVSAVLISSALETIAASKDAKRSAQLRESVQRALEMVKLGEGGDRPREIFEPLRLACETRNEKLMIASLDCISKLISYSFFAESSAPTRNLPSPPPSPGPTSRHSTSSSNHPNIPGPTLVDLVVHTITSCHTESTPDTVSLQIVKALLSLVLSPTVLVHQSSLLKAVRTVYNIFLLSTDPINQTVAQGGLTQMVNHVFTRCKVDSPSPSRSDSLATLSSSRVGERRSSMRQSYRPTSPLSVQRPLSPPSTADYASIAGTMETGTTLVDTPVTESAELPAEGESDMHTNGHPPQQAE